LRRNRKNCQEVAVNEQFLPGKSKLFLNCLKKSTFFENLPGKIEIFQKFAWRNQNFSKMCLEKSKFFVKLPEKIEISQKFAWKNRNFVDSDPRPPDFKPD